MTDVLIEKTDVERVYGVVTVATVGPVVVDATRAQGEPFTARVELPDGQFVEGVGIAAGPLVPTTVILEAAVRAAFAELDTPDA